MTALTLVERLRDAEGEQLDLYAEAANRIEQLEQRYYRHIVDNSHLINDLEDHRQRLERRCNYLVAALCDVHARLVEAGAVDVELQARVAALLESRLYPDAEGLQ